MKPHPNFRGWRITTARGEEVRWCGICADYLPPDQFHRNRASRAGDGLQTHCAECANAIGRRSYARHRERAIARTRAWQKANPKKVRRIRREAQRVYWRTHPEHRARHRDYVRERKRRLKTEQATTQTAC